ncbi:MAG: MbnP family protein [Ferruginibacter sp.]
MIICLMAVFSFRNASVKTGTLKITFVNTANGKQIVLRDSMYNNAFGEQYNISKLKYYISNVFIPISGQLPESDAYHLINAAEENNSFEIKLNTGDYKSIQFLLGVDSARNCSGAQTGALDPMNDMFWTWNTGYVMFKLEGTSAASTADLNRIEQHIGGYKAANNVATLIQLNFPQGLSIKENAVTELSIEMNLDRYWKGNTEIKISETPMWMTMGGMALKIALNFSGLFSVMNIK